MAAIIERQGKRGTTCQVIVRRRGHPTVIKSFTTKRAADAFATNIESDMQRGRFANLYEAERDDFR